MLESLYNIYTKSSGVSISSLEPLEEKVFFGLKGQHTNGSLFAEEALDRGAKCVVIEDKATAQKLPKNKCFLTKNSLVALQDLARMHRKTLSIPIIGLTGSNGKTTTKELIASVLKQKFECFATHGNLNNHIGVALSILSISQKHEIAVIEMGANHVEEIAFLCSIAQPSAGLITNVGLAHLEGFGGFDGVKKGKGELYEWLQKCEGSVFINQDNEHLTAMAQRHTFKEVVSYGTTSRNIVSGKGKTVDDLVAVDYKYNGEQHYIQTHLTGLYNTENVLASIAIGYQYGLDYDTIKAGIESYIPQNIRSQKIRTKKNTVIADAYNANPSSMYEAINNLHQERGNHKIAILGDMLELGEHTYDEHKKLIEQGIDYEFELWLVGPNFRAHEPTFKTSRNTLWFNTAKEVLLYLDIQDIREATILVKGSRGMRLEEVLGKL